MADHTFQLEGNSVGDGLRAKQNIPESCKNVYSARNPKGSRSSRFFAGLSYDSLISESVEDEAGIRTIINEAEGRLNPGEDALRLILDTTPALIYTGRPDGYLDYFNQRWLEFLGLPLEEVCGWRWTGAVHPEDVAGLLQKWHAALGSGEPLEAEARVRRADGEYRLLLHRKVPLRNERGAILKWYGSSVDIEEQRRAQESILLDERERLSEALLAEAQRLTRIGTSVQRLTRIGSFVFRLPDATEYWSPESFQIFGVDPAKGHPRNMSEYTAYVHPDDRERFLREAEEILAKGQAYEHNHRIVRPDGEIRVVRVVGCPVHDSGVVTRFIGVFADITEREKAFEEIKALKDELYKENIVLREEVDKTSMFEEVVGTSPALQTVLARAAKVAPTDSTVLILGETGTGKELIARAIHKRSQRAERAFFGVNCAAIPASLIASELFGHEKGAFTGATQRRLGRFESAN